MRQGYAGLLAVTCAAGVVAQAGAQGGAMPAPPGAAPRGGTAKATRKPAPPMLFRPLELDLAPGDTYRVELAVPSPTGKAITTQLSYEPAEGVAVHADPRWKDRIPPWGAKTYPRIQAAQTARGEVPVRARLAAGGEARLLVRVAAPRMEPIPGAGKLTVRVTNPFKTRAMRGRVQAANPDRFLGTVTARPFDIPAGMTGEVEFPLPGAAPAESEAYSFTLTLRTFDGHESKETFPLRFPPQPPK